MISASWLNRNGNDRRHFYGQLYVSTASGSGDISLCITCSRIHVLVDAPLVISQSVSIFSGVSFLRSTYRVHVLGGIYGRVTN